MNKSKITLSIAIIIITILFMIIPGKVNASTTLTTPMYFGIREFREETSPENLAYAIRNPYDNGSTDATRVGTKIWQIVRYNSSSGGTFETGNFYCARGGVGFTDTSDVSDVVTYNIAYDLKTEKNAIATSGNSVLRNIVNNGYYNSLLALTDLMYLRGITTDIEREQLLKAAGIEADNYEYMITDSDIEAIQQAAMWYFTNHDDAVFSQVYDNLGLDKTSWLFYRTAEMEKDGEEYTSFSDYNLGRNEFGGQSGEGLERQEQAILLYNYLINTANENAQSYEDGTAASKTKVTLYATANRQNTQPIVLLERKIEIPGEYGIVLVKQDENGEQLNSEATFEVNGEIKTVVGKLQIAEDVQITSQNVTSNDTYVIKETIAPDEYCEFDGIITVTVTKKNDNGTYKIDKVMYKVTDEEGNDITDKSQNAVRVYLNDDGNIYVEVKNYQFDLKLVKRIVEINGVKVDDRIEDVDITDLSKGDVTTATYTLNKTPIAVKNGDIIKYTLRVYNEGNMDGYASEITEDIPNGLELVWSEKTGSDLDQDTILSDEEKEAIKYNQLIWSFKEVNTTTNKPELISTDYLAKGNGAEVANDGANLIKAFDSSKDYKNTINDKNPDYKEVSVYLKVVVTEETPKIIRNEAAITGDTDKDGNPVEDRDSKPEDWAKYEDDEDYDNVILEAFDLSLRKFIIAVSKDTTIESFEYLKNSNGTYTRAPILDTSSLNAVDGNGNITTTAIYNHTKEPVGVVKKDIVVYMIRVYNEGDIDGYASEITDHLPPYLEYVDSQFNQNYGWQVSANGRTVRTSYLDNYLISKTTTNEDGEIVLSYKEVPIMCRVTDNAQGKITNIADITISKDGNKQEVDDRDSEENNVVLPADSQLPTYKDNETGSYVPGQQDDDDFEKLVLKKFDLALRKFITEISGEEVTSRIPQVNYDSENNKITYQHTKDPMDVVTGDIVVYTIRVYNEGQIDGYASKITDDIPDGLEYLPENDLNKEYRWIMYDKDGKQTEEISRAVKITTDYLAKEQNEEIGLLEAFDKTESISDGNPDYADVKVAFKVVEPNESIRIIVNAAQISGDTDENGSPIDDDDSIPDEWNDGEDDQDREYIKLNYFDLALRKWVTHAIVIEDGVETVIQTGHKAEDNPEQVVKVEIKKKKLNTVTVKFKYSIKVTNEGDLAGYAKEITDYIPDGLKFVESDNKDWIDEGNNVISTKQLENTLLQPGESAEVEVVLTWINDKDNMGLKVNVAEISEDDNDRNALDRDSIPDNQIPGEDDQDDAPVIVTISTGQNRIYYTLGFAVLITLASGIILIKKFVL